VYPADKRVSSRSSETPLRRNCRPSVGTRILTIRVPECPAYRTVATDLPCLVLAMSPIVTVR